MVNLGMEDLRLTTVLPEFLVHFTVLAGVFSAKSKISLIFEITVCYSLHIFDIGCKFVD